MLRSSSPPTGEQPSRNCQLDLRDKGGELFRQFISGFEHSRFGGRERFEQGGGYQ
ncbi:MAG: hypothetical protein AAF662_04455 [Pseudomonadota bacterium]